MLNTAPERQNKRPTNRRMDEVNMTHKGGGRGSDKTDYSNILVKQLPDEGRKIILHAVFRLRTLFMRTSTSDLVKK